MLSTFQQTIEEDEDIGYQFLKNTDFDSQDSSFSNGDLMRWWSSVKEIFLNARDYKNGSRDENAWCNDVVIPLLRLAIMLRGDSR